MTGSTAILETPNFATIIAQGQIIFGGGGTGPWLPDPPPSPLFIFVPYFAFKMLHFACSISKFSKGHAPWTLIEKLIKYIKAFTGQFKVLYRPTRHRR